MVVMASNWLTNGPLFILRTDLRPGGRGGAESVRQGANDGKLPIEIVVTADERHHTAVRKPRTHASRRASEPPVSARAEAVIRPVPMIIALYPSFYGRPRTNTRPGQIYRRHSIPDSIPLVPAVKYCPWHQRILPPCRIHRPYHCFRP